MVLNQKKDLIHCQISTERFLVIYSINNVRTVYNIIRICVKFSDSIPDSESGNVEEDLRLALSVQKKNFHKKNSMKRKAESLGNN